MDSSRGYVQVQMAAGFGEEAQPTKLWLSNLPEEATLRGLVYWAKTRWWVEQNYQQLKNELGLDHFEGRFWAGWHYHATLTLIAFDFLVLEGFRSKKLLGGLSHAPNGNFSMCAAEPSQILPDVLREGSLR